MSQNGFQSNIWGPPAWLFLHCITLNFTPGKHCTAGYVRFFKSLQHVLPCGTCRTSYAELIQSGEYKLTDRVFESRGSLVKWLFHVHNAINLRTGKTLTFSDDANGLAEMKRFYEPFRAKCDKKPTEVGCVKAKRNGQRYRCVLMLKPVEASAKSIPARKRRTPTHNQVPPWSN
jgi:hypothetical protein